MSNILGNMPPVFGSGYRGVVPAPSAADVSAQNILRADGTWGATPSGAIPSQTGNATKLLTTDGTNASWSGAVTVSGSNATVGGNLTVSGVTTSAGISNSGALTFTAAIGQVAGSIAKNATYGLTYYGVTGSSNDNTMLNASGAVVLSNPAGTTNATLAGNLTVSGTGTSSIGGNTKIGNPANANQRLVVDGAVAGVGVITTNTGLSGGYLYSDGGTGGVVAAWNGGNYSALSILGSTVTIGTGASGTTAATISSGGNLGIGTTSPTRPLDVRGSLGMQVNEDNAGTKVISIRSDFAGAGPAINVTTNDPLLFLTNNSERARITSGGNLLLKSDGIDSSNGKLQLATHTTSAGGIGFGTDWSLHRVSSSYMGLTATGSTTGSLSIGNSTNPASASTGVILQLSANDAYLWNYHGGTFYIGNNNGTALSFDSSRNATFAGTILASSATGFVLNLSDTRSQAAGNGASIGLRGTYTGSSQTNFAAVLGLKVNSTDGNYAGKMVLQTRPNGGALTDALTLDDSQNATFAGGIIGMTQGNVDNISDDGVASFTPLYNRGFIVINNPDYSQNALIAYFKAGSSYLLYSITKSADVTLNNSTTLTGTTGTDGKLNIGYNNSIIYIENRLGGIGNFQRYALGGTNN